MTYNPKKAKSCNRTGAGRPAELRTISSYEAKQEALLMIRRGKFKANTKLYSVIGLLGTTGVLPEEQLTELGHLTARSLRRYRKNRILDNVPTPKTIRENLNTARLWTLGPIGLQLAKIQFDLVPTGYLESKIDNITHDVLCNYVYYQIYRSLSETEYTPILKSRYEVSLTDFRNQQILQPDAMIILRHENGKETHFLVEYHNENFSSRAAEKVKKYEYVYTDVDWREQWHIKTFPPILIATTHGAVAHGYKRDIEERSQGVGVKCRYLIKPLKSFLSQSQSPLVWLDLAKNKTVNILSS